MSTLTIQRSSTLLREEWFYDDVCLVDDDGTVWLFVRRFIEYETKAGNVHRRHGYDLIELPDWDAVRSWVEEHDAKESGDPEGENRDWVPEGWEGAKR